MPQDRLERARVGYDAWSRGDIEGMLATLDDNVEFWTSGVFPGLDRVYRGHAGMRKFWEDFRGPWNSVAIYIDHFREQGEQVVVLFRFEAVGRDGLTVRRQAANVITFRGDEVVRIDAHGEWESALEAAGVTGQESPPDLAGRPGGPRSAG